MSIDVSAAKLFIFIPQLIPLCNEKGSVPVIILADFGAMRGNSPEHCFLLLLCHENEYCRDVVEHMQSHSPPESEVDTVIGYSASGEKRYQDYTEHVRYQDNAVVAECYHVQKPESYCRQPHCRFEPLVLLALPEPIGRKEIHEREDGSNNGYIYNIIYNR